MVDHHWVLEEKSAMPKAPTFTPAEISALADRLRKGWRPGSQITPWIRDNVEKLTQLHREERFSWAAVAAALNEVGIVYRTGNSWTATNLAKAVSEFRYGARGNPTAEEKAANAEWSAKQKAIKAKEITEFAAEWKAMTREEQVELLALWRTDALYGDVAGRFLAKNYRKTLPEKAKTSSDQ
jgi:hypothetical protein